jgi:alpha-methylacyl-CoA racemase
MSAASPSSGSTPPSGPLAGVRVVELGAIGPVPFAGAVLAGLGAEVIRVQRPGAVPLLAPETRLNVALRSRTRVVLDLKEPLAVEAVLRLAAGADALLEGWRPGVAERLGVGPDACLERNAQLVYGRMTGWGQDGPLSATAGHDINYVALTGALHAIGRAGGPPVPPLNLVGDFGGGGMLLAVGVLSALLEARASGRGQVVDAAMVDGAALLALSLAGYVSAGLWSLERGTNMLDSGAPFYDVYETADSRWVAVGAIEAPFYAALLAGLEIDPSSLPDQLDREGWPELRTRLAERFRMKTRGQWEQTFAGTDACVTPVLTFAEAPAHPHNVSRGSYVELDGIPQPAPAPRFSRTPAPAPTPPAEPEADTRDILGTLGFDEAEIEQLAG